MLGTWIIRSLQRLSPSFSFEIDDKICQRNLTRIDRTIQKCFARRIGPVVSDDGSWVASGVSAKSAQRAQFTFSTHGIVTHSKAQGCKAGAQPTFFMSARPEPLGALASRRSPGLAELWWVSRIKDGPKEHQPPPTKSPW